MYISKAFIPILKNNPSEAKIKSHQLMLRVGMIKQSSAGIYSWLPLGFKVMKKIEQSKVNSDEKYYLIGINLDADPRHNAELRNYKFEKIKLIKVVSAGSIKKVKFFSN